MARPQNPLDKYVQYTYHFELHAAKSWDDLLTTDGVASEKSTTRFASNGTLLINTRKDAHQVIEDLTFESLAPGTSRTGAPVGAVNMRMTIKEPGGFALVEKIKARMNELDISTTSFLTFGLKILFVGRLPDNDVEVKVLKLLPLTMLGFAGSFNHEGGTYELDFISPTTAASDRAGKIGQHLSYAYTNRNMGFEANTVQEALTELEKRLNENYEDAYSKRLNNNGNARPIKYRIEFDQEIAGTVEGVVKDSFSPSSPRKFGFKPQDAITTNIMTILKRSPDLCNKIAATSAAMRKSLHQGAFMPIIIPKVHAKSDSVEVVFQIAVYKGGGATFEFDYYFANAGQNVDVMSFDVNFNYLVALLELKTKTGADTNANYSAQVPNVDPKRYLNLVHEPTTQEQIYTPVERSDTNLKSGDHAVPPVVTKSSSEGYSTVPLTSVEPVRLASNAFADFNAAIDPEQHMVIRGHYDLLELCVSQPQESEVTALSNGGGAWCKVNIFMPDGTVDNGRPGKQQFFYMGHYQVISVQNIFSGGAFTQKIQMIMNESDYTRA